MWSSQIPIYQTPLTQLVDWSILSETESPQQRKGKGMEKSDPKQFFPQTSPKWWLFHGFGNKPAGRIRKNITNINIQALTAKKQPFV